MRILITAGPTREYFDRVRFISNASSGKMGYALARAAARRGHDVVLVSGPLPLDPPQRVRIVRVTSAAEMLAASRRAFASCDAAVFTAAVCDYRPVHRSPRKSPKKPGRWYLELEPTADIAAALGRRKGPRICIAFALEDHAARPHAEAKFRRKFCDAIVLNGPGNIGEDRARVELLDAGGRWERWPVASKLRVADRLIRRIEQLARDRAST